MLGKVLFYFIIFKGILHQKKFCRLNLIFWIVMGCGIAHFARRGLKTASKFWYQILSPGVSRRGEGGVLRHGGRGFEAWQEGFRGTAKWGFEGRRGGVLKGGDTIRTSQCFIIPAVP